MSKKWMIATGAGLAVAALCVGAAVAAETNGSFEEGINPPVDVGFRTLSTNPANSTDITGWTVLSGSVDWVGDHWQPSEGSRSIDLNGNATGAIGQTFATAVGATYAVTFDLSGNPDNTSSPASKSLEVSATGATPMAFAYDVLLNGNSRSDMKWDDQLYTFLATSTTTELTFTSTTVGAWGPALDNVVITETLPKAADCKKDGWQTMIDSSGNTFKNQGDCVSFFATDGRNAGDGS